MDKDDKLKRLKDKKDKLSAQIKLIEARDASRLRKEDTRRKILVGAHFMDKADKDGNLNELLHEVKGVLKRNSDKKLFE